MGRAVYAWVLVVCLLVSTLAAQDKKASPDLEAFADRLVSVLSEADQVRLLEENKPFFNPDLVELLHQR